MRMKTSVSFPPFLPSVSSCCLVYAAPGAGTTLNPFIYPRNYPLKCGGAICYTDGQRGRPPGTAGAVARPGTEGRRGVGMLGMRSSLTFGELLKRYRTAAELTQEELAERARL